LGTGGLPLEKLEVRSVVNGSQVIVFSKDNPNMEQMTFQMNITKPGEQYTFQSQVTNKAGSSGWSLNTDCVRPEIPESADAVCYSNTKPIAPVLKLVEATGDSASFQIIPDDSYIGEPDVYYEVRQDDWWTNTPLTLYKESLKDTTFTNSSLIAGSTYHLQARATNSAGTSEWSELISVTMPNAGLCGNPHDVQVERELYDKLADLSRQCGESCILNAEACTKKCMKDKTGMSEDCGDCWYKEGKCVMKHCVRDCVKSPTACSTCFNTNCMPALVECSGIPAYAFPPPE